MLAHVTGLFLKGETRCEPAAQAQRGTGRTEAARHRCRVLSGRRPASVPSQVHCGATVLPETWAVWWYHDHTVLQLELWMMDDESSAWEAFLPACFNSVWLQALNIAHAFTSVYEGMWWLPRSLFFLLPAWIGMKSLAAEWCDILQADDQSENVFRVVWFLFENSKPLMLSEFPAFLVFSLLDDDHRLFFNLHLTPSGCGAPFLGIQHIFAVLDNPVKKKKGEQENK